MKHRHTWLSCLEGADDKRASTYHWREFPTLDACLMPHDPDSPGETELSADDLEAAIDRLVFATGCPEPKFELDGEDEQRPLAAIGVLKIAETFLRDVRGMPRRVTVVRKFLKH